MSRIPIEKTVFDKDAFNKVVSTQFNQLQPASGLNQAGGGTGGGTPSFTLEDFLALFDSLYDLIPPDVLRQLLEKIAGTLGANIDTTDVQALLDEITSLRQQLVDIQSTIDTVSKYQLISNQA